MRITRGNRAALLIYSILFFCLILYNEFFEYARMRRSWKLSPGELGMTLEHPDNVKILFVGDPQIQGIINEPPSLIGMLSRWDSDTYLRRTFQLAIHFFEPDIVVFLGDLVDEGSIATKQQYSSYQKRFFDNIFVIPKYLNVKMVLLAGDNDIGGEGSDKMTYELARRFEENFDSLSEVVPYKNVDVLKFNLVPWMRPTDLVDEEIFRKELDEDIEDLILKSDNKFRVLITHNSLGGVKESRRAELIYRLKPHFVFTAHSHRGGIFKYNTVDIAKKLVEKNPAIVQKSQIPGRIPMTTEFMVPTCSYRMGVKKMAYGVAVIDTTGHINYTLLPLPSRYYQLYRYVIFLMIPFVIMMLRICGGTKRRWR